jgi:flagellar assembly protein FliH
VEPQERVIDSNSLIDKRINNLSISVRKGKGDLTMTAQDGFVQGLAVPDITQDLLQAQTDELQAIQSQKENALHQIEEAKEQAQQILKDAATQAQQEKNSVLAAAKQQGLEIGRKEAKQELEKQKRLLQQQQDKIIEELHKEMEEFEPRFVDTITQLYETVFQTDLKSHRDILLHLISVAMRKAPSSHEFLIKVSAEDYPFVSMHKKELSACIASANSIVSISEDTTLTKTQCLIETDGGIFDCGLDTQLAELGQKLKLLSYQKRKPAQ